MEPRSYNLVQRYEGFKVESFMYIAKNIYHRSFYALWITTCCIMLYLYVKIKLSYKIYIEVKIRIASASEFLGNLQKCFLGIGCGYY